MLARKSTVFFACIVLNIFLLFLISLHASHAQKRAMPSLNAKSEMVKRLGLTDLCLFTDARYTRNPAVADLNSPFQDYPMSFEHFPSGSLVPAPQTIIPARER